MAGKKDWDVIFWIESDLLRLNMRLDQANNRIKFLKPLVDILKDELKYGCDVRFRMKNAQDNCNDAYIRINEFYRRYISHDTWNCEERTWFIVQSSKISQHFSFCQFQFEQIYKSIVSLRIRKPHVMEFEMIPPYDYALLSTQMSQKSTTSKKDD